MACKHEGGSDPCVKNTSGSCKIHKNSYHKAYRAKHVITSGLRNHQAGCAAEKFVAFDLYTRGAIELTWPDDPNSPDDIYVRFSSGWYGVQVKTGQENITTGRIYLYRAGGKRKISSHVLAIVSIPSRIVRYLPNTKELPEELRMVQ